MDILMRLHDTSKVDELNSYGEVVYVSQYTNVVGMSCTKHNFHRIRKLKNVYDCEEAATGELLKK